MNVVQRERVIRTGLKNKFDLIHKDTTKGVRSTSVLSAKPGTVFNAFRSINKGPRYDFSAERSSSKSRKSFMGPPSGPPRVKRKTINNSSSRQDSWSGARPRILANDSDIVDNDFSTPKNRPTALRYISSSSRGGHSGTRSARSTSTSFIEASVILAISEGRGMARGEIGMAAVDLRHPHLVLCQFSDTLFYTHTLTKINLFHPVEIIVPHTFCEGVQPNQLYKLIKEQFPLVQLTAVQRRHFNDTAGRQNIQMLCIPEYSAVYHQVIHKIIGSLLKELRPFMPSLYKLCEDVAELDILLALAQASSAGSYIRPDFNEYMEVRNSVHPLLDYNSQVLPVPNDIFASPEYNFTIITGPNMGGKSIYIKQVAIQQIMAQLGCFVPATNAMFRLCDKIFSRIGFNDSVEFNASTYVIEMKEMQHILKGLTSTSLVIIDELCRGTSIEEGTSIAWAICEELILSNAFTFFTTHFLYLTRLQDLYCNVVNRHTSVREEEVTTSEGVDKKLVYEHRLEVGVTPVKNYGLTLAAKTNLPKHTVDLAKELAELIEANEMPSEIRTPIQHFDEMLYKLNADIQKEYRQNKNSTERIKQIYKNFKIQNPLLIENIKMQNSINSIDRITSEQDKSEDSKPEISTESDKTPKISVENKTTVIEGADNKNDDVNENYTSVKSSTDLLCAYANPANDVDGSFSATIQNIDQIKEINSTNSNTDEILNSSNCRENSQEQYLNYVTEDLNTNTIHSSCRILSLQNSPKSSSSNIFEKSNNNNSKELLELINSNRISDYSMKELDSSEENNLSGTESDIAAALTQIIEDTIARSDEELIEETVREINNELQDVHMDFDLLTPPLAFRD